MMTEGDQEEPNREGHVLNRTYQLKQIEPKPIEPKPTFLSRVNSFFKSIGNEFKKMINKIGGNSSEQEHEVAPRSLNHIAAPDKNNSLYNRMSMNIQRALTAVSSRKGYTEIPSSEAAITAKKISSIER